MKAILTGGPFHGKDCEVRQAFACVFISPTRHDGFANNNEAVPQEAYELVGVNARNVRCIGIVAKIRL